ncbi:MAG TPA: lipid A biosynthesis acyltransferase [Myxococcota bacterium]|nr:lipid A biosynthesis acyltransferase [Myxococcota bacterium]
MTKPPAWHQRGERGSALGMRITVWLYRTVGRRAAELLVWPIVAYFFLTDREARRASRAYLERVHSIPEGARRLGREPGPRLVFAHLLAFGISLLDRVAFWLGRREDFDLDLRGDEHLARIVQEGRGGVVLGSHLGSFDAMRLLGAFAPIPVNVLMYTQHAARINEVFARLAAASGEPAARVRVLPVRENSFEHVLEARACIARGEVVAILADRTPPSDLARTCRVKFLGGIAAIPEGPFRLAAVLGAPIVFMVAVRSGVNAYEVDVEPLGDGAAIPRERRRASLQSLAQTYADRLAAHCLRVPLQWFNFHDFWLEDGHGGDA